MAKTDGSGRVRVRVGSNGSQVKTGHGSKRVIFKRVNRVTSQTGCGSNGSGQTSLTRFAMSKFMDTLLKSSIFNAPTCNSSVKSLFDSVSLYLVPSNKQMRMPLKILQRNNKYPFRLALNCIGRCGFRNYVNSRYREKETD